MLSTILPSSNRQVLLYPAHLPLPNLDMYHVHTADVQLKHCA